MIDLEDGVAPSARPAARRALARWLQATTDLGGSPSPEVWVRVNSFGGPRMELLQDLQAAARPGVIGVCLAKVRSVADVRSLDELLTSAEQRAGLVEGSLKISAIIETAEGLLDARSISRGPRITELQLGEWDLMADLRLRPGPDDSELLPARFHVVLVSAASGIDAPVGPVSTNFTDLETLRESTERLKRLGFGGRAVIHPAQVAVVNDVFTPSVEEVERARDLIGRFEAAVAMGSGVILDENGRMVDEAIVRAARHIVESGQPKTPVSDG